MNPETSSGSGEMASTGFCSPRVMNSAKVWSVSRPSASITITLASSGRSDRKSSISFMIAVLATKTALAPLSLRMYCHSFGSWASYIGTTVAPSEYARVGNGRPLDTVVADERHPIAPFDAEAGQTTAGLVDFLAEFGVRHPVPDAIVLLDPEDGVRCIVLDAGVQQVDEVAVFLCGHRDPPTRAAVDKPSDRCRSAGLRGAGAVLRYAAGASS